MVESKIKVLVVEDEALIAEDLSLLLKENDFNIAGVAHTGSDAIDMLHTRTPSFAILDINLGGGLNGIDIAKIIDEKYKLPYIFLTSFDDDGTLEEAQSHSPYGYLVKPYQERTLLATIKTAISNYNKLKNQKGLDIQTLNEKAVEKITDQEFKIIVDLTSGLSYKRIAEKHFISINTVKYHAKNIYSKFDVKGRSELVASLL